MAESGAAAAGDLVVYPARKKLLIPILICAVFVVIGIRMVTSPETTFYFHSKGAVMTVGWIGLAFFGLGGLSLVARAVSPRPVLLLDESGLTNRTNLASVTFLPWSEIVGTKRASAVGKEILVIEVADPERMLTTCKSPLRRSLVQKSYQDGYGVSNIPAMSVPGSLDDLQRRVDLSARRA